MATLMPLEIAERDAKLLNEYLIAQGDGWRFEVVVLGREALLRVVDQEGKEVIRF